MEVVGEKAKRGAALFHEGTCSLPKEFELQEAIGAMDDFEGAKREYGSCALAEHISSLVERDWCR